MSSLLDLVCSTVWAVRPEALRAIVGLVQREDISRQVVASAFHYSEARQREAARAYETRIPLQAVGAYQANHVRDSFNLYQRGSVAVLPITGPITRYSNFFQMMSGNGTSVESLAKDFTAALDDPSFSSILLSVDSPGGEANGINELADMIFQARGVKPIWAYVSDMGTSAAYWLASAAERVIVAETAGLGSIGCIAVFHDALKPSKDVTFVSSVSPNKYLDPTTKSGSAQVQALVDTLGQIFVNAVAKNRGIEPDEVISNYGGGSILIGANAVDLGMADSVGSFEGVLAELESLSSGTTVQLPRRAAVTLVDRVASLEPLAPVLATTIEVASSAVPPEESDVPDLSIQASEADMSDQSTPPTPTIDHAQAELAALRAENQRLRLASHKANGAVFADARIAEMKAFPAERDHLISLYVQAALDDEQLGPGLEGNLRVQSLANAIASRTSVSFLTAEAIAPTAMQALHAKTTAAPSDVMTEDKQVRLLGATPLGKSLINGSK